MKRAMIKSGILIIFIALTISSSADSLVQQQQDYYGNKRETMKNVLEALEEGKDYDSTPYWREHEYGFSHRYINIPDFNFDFDWDFPEFRIDEEFIDDLERKLEIMEQHLHEQLQKLEKKIDSINERYS